MVNLKSEQRSRRCTKPKFAKQKIRKTESETSELIPHFSDGSLTGAVHVLVSVLSVLYILSLPRVKQPLPMEAGCLGENPGKQVQENSKRNQRMGPA